MAKSNLDTAVSAALWWRDVKSRTVPAFLPLLFDEHRHLVLKGGGGSGKSIFAGQKIIERCVSEPGHRFLVSRKVARTLRQSCFHQLSQQAREMYPDEVEVIPRGNSSEMYIRFRNGSEILFAGLDDVEKLKSIHDITGIWIEEASEVAEGDFDQLDIRLRGATKYYKQIIISFNPISINHWLKKRFFDREDKRVRVHESTYRDNPFLPEEDRLTLEAYKETNPYYYTVYALGMWGVVGKTFFHAQNVQEQLEKQILPVRVGRFVYDYDGLAISNIRFVDDDTGFVRIYQEPTPGRPFVCGCDTAGQGSDSFVSQCLNNVTGQQAAILRSCYEDGMDEGLFAKQLYCLGQYYNEALLAVETNFSTHPQKELERLGYKNFYVRERADTYSGRTAKSFGFQTTSRTRPMVLGELQRLVREQPELIVDQTTLDELLTFTFDEKMHAAAEGDAHDDCVMALAIAYHARTQQRSYDAPNANGRKPWTKGMWEDYRNASAREKEQLLAEWGDPA
jgi:phage terminase large subunit